MTIHSYSTSKECFAALKNLGCRITPAIRRSFVEKLLYKYKGTYILLYEFKLID